MKSNLVMTPVFVLAALFYPNAQAAAQGCSSIVTSNGSTFSTLSLAGSTPALAWSNPNYAQLSDGSYASSGATLGILSSAYSDYLTVTNFGFSIPSSATICQIIVNVQHKGTGLALGAGATDKSVRLLQNGALYGADSANGATWPTSPAGGWATYGGSGLLASTWGGAWQPADVNSSNFGVAISTKLFTNLASLFLGGNIDQITVTIIYDPHSLLAITLGKFSATAPTDGDGPQLIWTADATTGSNFIIQRSGNGRDWQDIATVPATVASSGNRQLGSGSMTSYTYTDHSPLDGPNFYRLHMVNADGRSAYSTINEVTMENKTTVRCWPNPFVQTINVSTPHPVTRVTLKDLQGRTLYMRQTATPIGDWQIPAADLPPGLYFVQVGEQTLRVLKEAY